jgi:uncharacterized protein YndB with AHSA1/START domain
MSEPPVTQWLTNQDLADRYRVSIKTVREWRFKGRGPAGHKFGKHVRYALADVEAWERTQVAS